MSDLNTYIAEHWQAKAALDAAKEREKKARDALSDFLCKDEVSLKNKTLDLSAGYKLKHEVTRSLKVDKSHAAYREMPSVLTPEQLNKLVKEKKTLEFNYTTYKSLPTDVVEFLSQFMTVNDAVAIKYETKTDNR